MTVTFSTHMSKKGDTCPVCFKKAQGSELWYGHQVSKDVSHLGHENCLKAWLIRNATCPLCRASIALPLRQRVSNFLQSKAPQYVGGLASLITASAVMICSIQMLGLKPYDVASWWMLGGIIGLIEHVPIAFSINSIFFGRSLLNGEIKNLNQLKKRLLNIPYDIIKVAPLSYLAGAVFCTLLASGCKIYNPPIAPVTGLIFENTIPIVYFNLPPITGIFWEYTFLIFPIGIGAVTLIGSATALAGFSAYHAANRTTKCIGSFILSKFF